MCWLALLQASLSSRAGPLERQNLFVNELAERQNDDVVEPGMPTAMAKKTGIDARNGT